MGFIPGLGRFHILGVTKARAPQLLSPHVLEPERHNRSHRSEKPTHRNWRGAPTLCNWRKHLCSNADPAQPKINKSFLFKSSKKLKGYMGGAHKQKYSIFPQELWHQYAMWSFTLVNWTRPCRAPWWSSLPSLPSPGPHCRLVHLGPRKRGRNEPQRGRKA